MRALLEKIDLFGHRVNFNYEKKSVYHSFFGIGLSFFVYIVLIYLVFHFSLDLILESNPKIIFHETGMEKETNITFDDFFNFNNISVTISLESFQELKTINSFHNKTSTDHIGQFIMQHSLSYVFVFDFLLKVNHTKETNNNRTIYKYKIEGEVDDNTRFYKENIFSFSDTVVRETIDIKKKNFTLNNDEKLKFAFQLNSTFLNYLNSIGINNGFSFTYSINDCFIDPYKKEFFTPYLKPMHSFATFNRNSKSFESLVLKSSHYTTVNLTNDVGFITSKKEIHSKFKLISHSLIVQSNRFLIPLHEISIDGIVKNYYRTYKKLTGVVSEFGGLIKSFIMIGNFIILQFNKKKFDYDLINNVFSNENQNYNQEAEKKYGIKNCKIQLQGIDKNYIVEKEVESSKKLMKNSIFNDTGISKNYIPYENKCNQTPTQRTSNLRSVYSNINKKENFTVKRRRLNFFIKDVEIWNSQKNFNGSQSSSNLNNLNIVKDSNKCQENIDNFFDKHQKGSLFEKLLKYSKRDFLMSFVCCNRIKGAQLIAKEKIFIIAQNEIYKYLDVINYVDLFKKIDQIIFILFNEHQVLSFNFIENKKINYMGKIKIDKESIQKVVEYYKENIKKSKMSIIDEKLLELFYPAFSQLI